MSAKASTLVMLVCFCLWNVKQVHTIFSSDGNASSSPIVVVTPEEPSSNISAPPSLPSTIEQPIGIEIPPPAANNSTVSSSNLLRNHLGHPSEVHGDNRNRPLAVYSIFAGRKDYLEMQLPYILKLLERNVIDEVHLWNYTCRHVSSVATKNSDYMTHVFMPSNPRIFLVTPEGGSCEWTSYYKDYPKLLTHPLDVLLKVDDDVIYMDTNRVEGFIQSIRKNPTVFLWSANVINNGKSAAFAKLDGTLSCPTLQIDKELTAVGWGELYKNGATGLAIHKEFLENPTKFQTPPPRVLRRVRGRISINCIAFLGVNLKKASNLVISKSGNDETALTGYASRRFEKILLVYMPLVVAHASFGRQQIGERVLRLYKNSTTLGSSEAMDWQLPANLQVPSQEEAMM